MRLKLSVLPLDPPNHIAVWDDGRQVGHVHFAQNDGISAYVDIQLDVHGKGYGTALQVPIAQYAFEVLKLHRLATTVVDGNDAAQRIAEKGMRREGRLKEAAVDSQGRYRDVFVYAILAREFQGGE